LENRIARAWVALLGLEILIASREKTYHRGTETRRKPGAQAKSCPVSVCWPEAVRHSEANPTLSQTPRKDGHPAFWSREFWLAATHDHSYNVPVINKTDAPNHLFNIPALDFSNDLFEEQLTGAWFTLGACTLDYRNNKTGVVNEISRQSFLLPPSRFKNVFDKLTSVGNINNMGKPSGSIASRNKRTKYTYHAFHQFQLLFTSVMAEPLVFRYTDLSNSGLFINPDLWLFLELVEKNSGQGIWIDPRNGAEALVRRRFEQNNLETIEIRPSYLLKYLQARQMSLIIGHYRQLLLYAPTQETIECFVKKDVVLGSREQGVKAILQNWGLHSEINRPPFLQRRLHLWIEIKPPAIDLKDPWADSPPFDPYTFTLPTKIGQVAPARWRHWSDESGKYLGEECDFMEDIYFRQEVLKKYEDSSAFRVDDAGNIFCGGYWSLNRSTLRVGNELLSTYIGDFAEGIPFEEWPHWKEYAVAPPSQEQLKTLIQEETIPEGVNSLAEAFLRLTAAFSEMANAFKVVVTPLWSNSTDSLAERKLKRYYSSTANDDEFLERSTLASTFFIENLQVPPMRTLLNAIGQNLHQTFETPPTSLKSRKLLQRIALLALIIRSFRPGKSEIPELLKLAEQKVANSVKDDLHLELAKLTQVVKGEFAPLAFLYDLRTHGGVAHPPNVSEASVAAQKLGLPSRNWHRTDYLRLLSLITQSVKCISEHFESF
jgi:hypothetical protein